MYNVQWEHGRSYTQPYYAPVCDPAGPVSALVMALIQYRSQHYLLPAYMFGAGTALLNYCSTGPLYIFVIYQNYFFRHFQTNTRQHYVVVTFPFFSLPYDNVGKFTNIPRWRFSCWQPINWYINQWTGSEIYFLTDFFFQIRWLHSINISSSHHLWSCGYHGISL